MDGIYDATGALVNEISLSSLGGAVIVVNWSDVAYSEALHYCPNDNDYTQTYAIAELLFNHAGIFNSGNKSAAITQVPLHLIGHSRGGSVVHALAHRLGSAGISVDQLTSLDPQPVECNFLDPNRRDFSVNVFENTIYADNYFQTDILNGGISLIGQAVSGGAVNVKLNDMAINHANIHDYYHFTIDTSAREVVGSSAINDEWFDSTRTNPERAVRTQTGYAFSRNRDGGRQRRLGQSVALGRNQFGNVAYAVYGMHRDIAGFSWLDSRVALSPSEYAWPNIYVGPQSDYSYSVGQTGSVVYFHKTQQGSATVSFHLDDNTNPFDAAANGCTATLGTQAVAQSAAFVSRTFTWPVQANQVGSCYVRVKILDANGYERFDYLPQALVITASGANPAGPPTLVAPGTPAEPGTNGIALTPTLTWNAVLGASQYQIYISKSPYGEANIVHQATVGLVTSHVVPSGKLADGTRYRWNMQALVNGTWSNYSERLYFTTSAATLAYPTMTNPGSSTAGQFIASSLTPTFSWNSVSGATGYGLYISKDPYGSNNIVYSNQNIPSNASSFVLPAGILVPGVQYRWNMTSFLGNTEGSANPNRLYFTAPGTFLNAPTANSPGTLTDTNLIAMLRPTLSWSQVIGASGYRVYLSAEPYGSSNLIYLSELLMSTSVTLPSDLPAGTKFRWQVTSISSAGNESPASNLLYFKTQTASGGIAQTISFSPASSVTFLSMGTFTLSGSASSGLPISYTASTGSICSISGNVVTMLAAGTCTITASQAGDASYAPAMPVTQSILLSSATAVVPGAPTAVSAIAGNTQASVSFTAPAYNGGAPITSYTVTSSPGGITATGTASPIVVGGLANGTAYTFTVVATNSAGTGAASVPSNAVTPLATIAIPNAFSFTSQIGVAVNATVTSNTITVSGITAAVPISVSGGTYNVNGGAYASTAGTVNNGDTVTVQLTASGTNSTQTCATLDIGGVTGQFCVTTSAAVGVMPAIAAGAYHSLALKSDGTLWAWGRNFAGQLGDGTTADHSSPGQVGTATDWAAVAAGDGHTVALKNDGTLWTWGYNSNGQLGDSTTTDRASPMQVGTATNWTAIAAGSVHTVALKSDGTLWAWGANSYGQLGDGTTTQRLSSVQVGTATNWTAVAAGYWHTVALKNDGTLWAWGFNSWGQLGDGTTASRANPTRVGTATNWIAIAAGGGHTLALKNDGTLWAWGYNSDGQLGDGTTIDRSTPVQVGTATNWVAVAAATYHTVALKSDGTVWAWGFNGHGQLGDGTIADRPSNRPSPMQVGTATNWTAVAAGGNRSVALKNDGTLWAWGANGNGELGDGTTILRTSPVQVVFDVQSLTYDLSVTVLGGGTVISTPAGISCASGAGTCSASFASGTPVTLTPTPGSGYVFSGWSGACTGTGGCTVTMDAAKNVIATFADTQAPSVPAGLTAAAVSSSQINLSWAASTDNVGMTAYQVFRGGMFRATVSASTTSFSDTGVTASTSYSYTVQACDAAGNCSAQSSPASATTQALPDTTPPTVPTGLTANAISSSQINLAWSASSDTGGSGIASYDIYRGGAQIATVADTSTSYSNIGLAASTSYSYTVQACDAAGNCSAQSAAVSATTLAPGMVSHTPQLELSWNLGGNSLDATLDVASIFGNRDSPVSGITENVLSVWKWDAAEQRWCFYSPSLSAAQNVVYAADRAYCPLSIIAPGEGYWVNAVTPIMLPAQSGSSFMLDATSFAGLPSSWNLLAINPATPMSPSEFNVAMSATTLAQGQVPQSFLSLWLWEAQQQKWYFYSPLLEQSAGLAGVRSYAESRGYLDFETAYPPYTSTPKRLGLGAGFWVNKP